jgi:hypothetical protein
METLYDVHRPSDAKNISLHKISTMKQTRSCKIYTQNFIAAAVDSGLGDPGLISYYKAGLKPSVLEHLIPFDEPSSFNEFSKLCIKVDDRIFSNATYARNNVYHPTPSKKPPRPSHDAMDLDSANLTRVPKRLSDAEKAERKKNGACMYCGDSSCPGSRTMKNDPEACPKLIAAKAAKEQGRH